MYHELLREEQNEIKAKAFETLCTLLNNALCFMYEQGMSKEDCADYIGTTETIIDAVNTEDAYGIVNEIR